MTLARWLDEYEAAKESGQTSITRDEAIKRFRGSDMQSTDETFTFITLGEALGDGQIKRIWAKRRHAKRGRPIHADSKLIAILLNSLGELYAGRWAASADTCKELDYETILVDFVESEQCT